MTVIPMETDITPPIRNWSFSKLLNFEACAYRVYLQYVLKVEQPERDESSPLVRGSRIHEEAEAYLRGQGELTKELQKPKIVAHLDRCAEAVQSGTGTVEEDWAFSDSWESVGWTDANAWLRMKLDATMEIDDDYMEITDWKTGRSAGKEVRNMQQAQIYAAGVFLRNPKIMYVQPIFAFTDEGRLVDLNVIERKTVPRYIDRYTKRANRLTTCTNFKAKPNKMNCKWCDFGPGGTKACAHGVE
jgi:RecB family exonuclease